MAYCELAPENWPIKLETFNHIDWEHSGRKIKSLFVVFSILLLTLTLGMACDSSGDVDESDSSGDSDTDTDTDSDSDTDTDTDTDADTDTGPDTDPVPEIFSAISLFQVIDISLLDESGVVLPVEARNAPIVADRAIRMVVYLDAPDGWTPAAVDIKVEVVQGGESDTYSSNFFLDEDSVAQDPSTAAQIDLPREAVQTDSRYSISLYLKGESDPYARIPETGDLNLGAEVTGPIKIHLVPYEVNGFTPETTPTVVNGFRDAVFALYPTHEVIISVGEVRPFGTNDVGEVLVDVGAVQESDNAPVDVYYYGIVSGVEDREDWEGSTGTSEDGGNSPNRAYFACGAAFEDYLSESTLIHELGHVHQLEHSPAGNPPNVDPNFPYPDGLIHILGFDFRTEEFIPPDTPDMMGYAQPRWIGEYHYLKLVDHVRLSQTW